MSGLLAFDLNERVAGRGLLWLFLVLRLGGLRLILRLLHIILLDVSLFGLCLDILLLLDRFLLWDLNEQLWARSELGELGLIGLLLR